MEVCWIMWFCGKPVYQEHFFLPSSKQPVLWSEVLLCTNISFYISKLRETGEQQTEKKIVEQLTKNK